MQSQTTNHQTSRFVYLKRLLDSRHFHPPSSLTPPCLSSSYEIIGPPVELIYPFGQELFPLSLPKKYDYSPLDDLLKTCEFIAQESVKSSRLNTLLRPIQKSCRQADPVEIHEAI